MSAIDQETVDTIKSLGKMNDGGDYLTHLLGLFSEQTQIGFGKIESAITSQELDEIRRTAHKVKGAAYTLGATEFAKSCESLETFALNDEESDFNREAVERKFQTMQETFKTACAALKAQTRPH